MTEKGLNELEKLHKEYESDVRITEFTINDVAMKVPTIKPKWLAIYWRYENDRDILQKEIQKLESGERNLTRAKLKVELSCKEIEALQLKWSKELLEKKERLEDLEFIIGRLAKYFDLIKWFGQDVKSAMDAIKMEMG